MIKRAWANPATRLMSAALVRARIPGRPRRRAAAKLREICLEAALSEFVEHGFKGATIEGAARRAKASRSTVYRMFTNKETLFRAIHRWVLESRQSDLRILLASGLAPQAMLGAVIEKIYLDSVRPRDLALTRLFVAEAHRFPELTDALFEHSLFEPLIDYLKGLAERGMADIDDPVEAAWDLSALAGGGLKMLLKEPIADPAALRTRTARLMRLLCHGWLRLPDVAK